MPSYIALFRGLNVGGRTLKMAALQQWLGEAGCLNVRTYLQSGNALFTFPSTPTQARTAIEKIIARNFGEKVPTLVKSAQQWQDIIVANPLSKKRGIDAAKLHCTLLAHAPAAAQLAKLSPKTAKGEQFEIVDAQIYLYCPNGYGTTKMTNNYFERALDTEATTRNWRTMLALQDMVASL